jgi:hypothetical protein
MANKQNTQTESTEIEATVAFTPIQLAAQLDEVLFPITGNHVPPQMVYNYITNNTRHIVDYTEELLVENKDGKKVLRRVFPEAKAQEFISVMTAAAKARKAKKEAREEAAQEAEAQAENTSS